MAEDKPESSAASPAIPSPAIDSTLDARGLACPLPLLKAKQALHRLPAGACLQVLATDPGSWRDFQVWCEQSGHGLLSRQQTDEQFVYLLQKQMP